MQRILVTTDYSTSSKAGIRFAIQFASQSPSEITFYHVFEGISDNTWNPKKGNSVQEERLNKLKKFVADVFADTNVPLFKCKYVVEIGFDVRQLVLEYAKKSKANYICISTRGAGVIKKLMGTHTSALIEHSPTPILVIPKNYRIKLIKEIWYSSDLANLKTELNVVRKFAISFKANVHIYHYDYMVELDEIKAKLNKIASKYITKDTFFHFKKMKIDYSISQHLQNDIIKHKPSLVVLFTKQNRSWMERMLYRNNTAEVTFDTKIPLLIMRKKSR